MPSTFPSGSGQTLILFLRLELASPALNQFANAYRHRFLVDLMPRTGRALAFLRRQGAAANSPGDRIRCHIRIMGGGGEKSPFRGTFTRLSDRRLGRHEWSQMSRLCSYEGIPRGPHMLEGDHVEDAVLTALEEDQISGFNRHRDMCDSQVIAGHVMDANGSSDTAKR